jgi:hypothetical protein
LILRKKKLTEKKYSPYAKSSSITLSHSSLKTPKTSLQIKIKLPSALPIKHPNETGSIAGALRSFFKFDLLPPTFFAKKLTLPDSVSELSSEYRNIFPITNFGEMRKIRELIDKLKTVYYVPNKLPESYFRLPPRKKSLPPTSEISPTN